MNLPPTDNELDQLTDFHHQLLHWLTDWKNAPGVPDEKMTEYLIGKHQKLYKTLYNLCLDPENVLVRLETDSSAVLRFRQYISEDQELTGEHDMHTSSPDIFEYAVKKFTEEYAYREKEKSRVSWMDTFREVKDQVESISDSLNQERAEERDQLISAYFENIRILSQCLSRASRDTCCEMALENSNVRHNMKKLAALVTFQKNGVTVEKHGQDAKDETAFFRKWLEIDQRIPNVDFNQSVESALNRLDESLIANGSQGTNRIAELKKINTSLRNVLRGKMQVSEIDWAVNYIRSESDPSQGLRRR